MAGSGLPGRMCPHWFLPGLSSSFSFWLAAFVLAVVHVFTKDFVVPQMALEGIGAIEGWRRLWPMIQQELSGYAIYAVMKVLLAIAAGILVGIASFLLVVVLAIPAVAMVLVAVTAGKTAGLTWNVFTITIAIVVACVLLAIVMFLVSLLSVPVIVFFPAYAMYFFAARYRRLALALYPPQAPPLPAAANIPPARAPSIHPESRARGLTMSCWDASDAPRRAKLDSSHRNFIRDSRCLMLQTRGDRLEQILMVFSMPGGGASAPQINVTPLIDVLLTLIIMFMLVVSMDPEYGEKAQIPEPNQKQAENQPQPRTIVIQVVWSGKDQPPTVKMNQEDVTWEELETRLARIYLTRSRESSLCAWRCRCGFSIRSERHRPGAPRGRAANRITDERSAAGGRISECILDPGAGSRLAFRARFLIQIGVPTKPNASRIWFSRKR